MHPLVIYPMVLVLTEQSLDNRVSDVLSMLSLMKFILKACS